MPARMVAPVRAVVMAFRAMTDNARAMHRRHPVAASSSDKDGGGVNDRTVGIVVVARIVIRIIVVIDASDNEPAEVMPVKAVPHHALVHEALTHEALTGKPRSTRNTRRRRDHRRSRTCGAATNEGAVHAAAHKTVTAAPTATTVAATSTSAAMSAANFNGQPVGDGLGGLARIHRRHRVGLRTDDRCDQECRRAPQAWCQRGLNEAILHCCGPLATRLRLGAFSASAFIGCFC